MKLSSRIVELREKNNWERDDLATRLGVSYSTIAKYETDKRQPDLKTLERLSEIFDVTVDYLIGRSNDPDLTAKQERLIDKETEEILELLDQLPRDMKKHYLELFKAHTENSERARDKN